MKGIFTHAALTNKLKLFREAICLRSVLLMLLSTACAPLSAQNPSLMNDANTGSATANFPGFLYSLNNAIYFDATGNEGNYLWKTDGTQSGTTRITKPAIFEDYYSKPVTINGITYYHSSGKADVNPDRLWKTDGTQEGTAMVTNKVVTPSNLYSYNGLLIFSGYDAFSSGYKIWKSDGTDAGTIPLTGIIVLTAGATVNNKFVYANADDLYVTDGTVVGTELLKNFTSGSSISPIVNFQGAAYFLSWDEPFGKSLYKTDGTIEGTMLVKDFAPSKNAEQATQLVVAGNKLFMLAEDASHGLELWSSDGTTTGTHLAKDINAGSADAFEFYYSVLYPIGNRVYFYANDGIHGKEPWYSDGTMAGTAMLADLNPGSAGTQPANFTSLGNDAIFTTLDFAGQSSLWITNGTTSGIQFVTHIPSSLPSNFIEINGKVIFKLYGGGPLWTTDGTSQGTSPFTIVLNETASSYPYEAVKANDDVIIYSVSNGNNTSPKYFQVWRSDGTPSGSYQLFPDNTIPYVFLPINLCPHTLNGITFFDAVTDTNGFTYVHSLWRTDGTIQGTFKLKEVASDFTLGSVIFNNVLYFITYKVEDANGQNELWRSDGTIEGTYRLKDINPYGSDNAAFPVIFNNQIYFAASDGIHGNELFKTDGTAPGTGLAVDIVPGSSSSSPAYIASINGKLYFRAKQSTTIGNEPWVSDGTQVGTFMLKDVNTSINKGSDPNTFTGSGTYIYFDANDNTHGKELWRTDGTSEGTILVKDVAQGKKSFDPQVMADVNGTLYFSGVDEYGEPGELWKTTGDESHTSLVIDKGYDHKFIDLNNVGGVLYAVAFSFGLPAELWRTDGTECHTVKIDFFPEVIDEQDNILLVNEGTIYLALNSASFGNELWKFTAPSVTNIEVCNGFDDDCNGLIDDSPTATISPEGIIEVCKGSEVTFTTDPGINNIFQWSKNGNAIAGATASTYSAGKNASGDYGVTVSGMSACVATSDETILDRLATPNAVITPLGSLDICSAGFVNLKANSGIGNLYQWSKNNHAIIGATAQTFHATSTGNYKVNVTGANGCSKQSSKTTVTTSCKNFAAANNEINLDIYPNPTAGILNIKAQGESKGTLVITNMTGEIVSTQTSTSSEISLDVSSLASGIYLLQYKTEARSIDRKFVKE